MGFHAKTSVLFCSALFLGRLGKPTIWTTAGSRARVSEKENWLLHASAARRMAESVHLRGSHNSHAGYSASCWSRERERIFSLVVCILLHLISIGAGYFICFQPFSSLPSAGRESETSSTQQLSSSNSECWLVCCGSDGSVIAAAAAADDEPTADIRAAF